MNMNMKMKRIMNTKMAIIQVVYRITNWSHMLMGIQVQHMIRRKRGMD